MAIPHKTSIFADPKYLIFAGSSILRVKGDYGAEHDGEELEGALAVAIRTGNNSL